MVERWVRNVVMSCVAALTLGVAVHAAHESNNFAQLSGIPGVSGHAIVNYVKGTEGWSSTVRVLGLPDGLYTFAVRLGDTGALQPVCSFEVEGQGSSGCSDQRAALMGFSQAVIVDFNNTVVVASVFERRGGNRAR